MEGKDSRNSCADYVKDFGDAAGNRLATVNDLQGLLHVSPQVAASLKEVAGANLKVGS